MSDQPPSRDLPTIRCSVRCLDPDSIELARAGLGSRCAVNVDYTCKISGESERLVLLSASAARWLCGSVTALGDETDAVLAAALTGSSLCECDLATLAARPDHDVIERLGKLRETGLLEPRTIHGMNYFALAPGSAGDRIRELVSTALSHDETSD